MSQSDNKRIAKNTLMLYIRNIFVMSISLYTTRVTLSVLGIENYGIYNIIGGTIAMFSIISTSLIAGSQRFITYALGTNNKERLKTVFDTCVSLHTIVAVAIIPILEILGLITLYYYLNIPAERMNAAFWVLQCSIFSLSIGILQVPYDALIIAHERMSAFAYISIIQALLKLGIVGCLVIFNFDKLILYTVLGLGVSIIIRLIYRIYSVKHFEEANNIRFSVRNSTFKEMLAFSGWNVFGNGSFLLRNQGIDMLLNIYFGVTINAAKGIASQVQSAITQFVSNFQSAVNPQLVKSVAAGDMSRNHELVTIGSRYSFYLMTLFAVPVIVNAKEILSWWLKTVPDWTVNFLTFTLIYCLLDCLSRFLINTILATGDIKIYQIIVGGTKLLAIPITLIILECGGNPITGIYVNIGLEIICLGQRLYFNRKYTNLDIKKYLSQVIGRCWGIFVLAIIIALCFREFMPNFFIAAVVNAIIAALCIFTLGINKKERNYVTNMVKTKIKRYGA
jgi:O-antigen/teichoic acid export membrane protein